MCDLKGRTGKDGLIRPVGSEDGELHSGDRLSGSAVRQMNVEKAGRRWQSEIELCLRVLGREDDFLNRTRI